MKDRRFFLVLILLVLTGLMSYASAEETLIENEKARVVLKSFEQKNDTVEMKLFLENKTDKNVMFSMEDAVLNGWETNPFWAVTVSGGKKANETVTWRSISDDGVSTDVSIVDLHFNIYDSEDWMAEHYFEGKVTLMPMGAEQAHYDPYLLGEGDRVLFDSNGTAMIYAGEGTDWMGRYEISVYLKNDTDRNAMFSVDDVSVNGFMMNPYWAKEMPARSQAISTITWSKDDFEENGIVDVSEIEMKVRVYDSENWTADDFFNSVVTIR